ncbi:MAG: agmatinase [Nitrospirae bacterium]|nr:agmatinase [Nitrospirota bacterium]
MRKATGRTLWGGLNQAGPADVTVVGIPYDGAVCYRRGAARGPAAIRRASTQVPAVLETGEVLTGLAVRDLGDRRIANGLPRDLKKLSAFYQTLFPETFPLTLGGDHSVVIPVMHALNALARGPVGLLVIDAHTDLSDTFQGSAYSNGCPLRRAMELPRFGPNRTVLVGVRCFEEPALRYLQEHKLRAIGPEELESRGVGAVADEVLDRFAGLSQVYLSIDIDALDPAYAPGTGIPDAGGLSPRQVITLIRRLDALPFVGADLVEVAPPLDPSEITSFAALKIIMEVFGLVLRRKRQGLSTHLTGAGR